MGIVDQGVKTSQGGRGDLATEAPRAQRKAEQVISDWLLVVSEDENSGVVLAYGAIV